MSAYTKPIPVITPEMRPFYDAAKRHELVVQHCSGCGAHRFPARGICSHCLSPESSWVKVSGEGEVFSFNVMHQIYHPGFATEVPYAVVVVKLAEGAKITSNLVGVKPHDITIGMPVRVMFEDIIEHVTLPKFRSVE
ncbi:MAG: Zn-ribbon domain-containing OB-fold protein [Deltaproteobacteria bacterium]|nr:Zn-ribbon domain-containing OB-fold protein [Deltaproteobacteria bacterium]MBI3389339.1 Zn-ribbon domain-containing OB-fold protein [Deltaproteobacteria bacterium]